MSGFTYAQINLNVCRHMCKKVTLHLTWPRTSEWYFTYFPGRIKKNLLQKFYALLQNMIFCLIQLHKWIFFLVCKYSLKSRVIYFNMQKDSREVHAYQLFVAKYPWAKLLKVVLFAARASFMVKISKIHSITKIYPCQNYKALLFNPP